MKLSESLKNFNESLDFDDELYSILNETSAAQSAAEFVGTKGQGIDKIFAGPYHPEFGKLKILLKKQLQDRDLKQKWNKEVTPVLDKLFRLIGFDYKFDKLEKLYNKLDFITKSETNMEYVGVHIDYDSNKSIYDKQHRDKDTFINKSLTNWQVINLTKSEK
jgi:hypothetical protein